MLVCAARKWLSGVAIAVRRTRFFLVLLVGCILLLADAGVASHKDDHTVGAAGIYESEGKKAVWSSVESVGSAPASDSWSAGTPESSSGPRYVGLIPHSCLPTSNPNVGVSFSDVLYEAATADCVAFSSPSPVRGNGAPRDGELDDVDELLAIASDEAVALAESPQLVVAPYRRGITGLRSFFWLARSPQPVSATAEVPGLSVTAEASPIRYIWDFGEGRGRATDHIGRPWSRKRPGNIGHMYEVKGRYDLAVEVIWQARWRSNGGAWQPLGYFVTSGSRPYRVREVAPGLSRSRR